MADLKVLARRISLALGLALFLVLYALSLARSRPKFPTSWLEPGRRRVERITIHGKALEGNLEGNAVDRTVLVFLPPSYAAERNRRYPVVYAFTATRSAPSNGRRKSTCRRQSKARSPRARTK